MVRLFVFGAVCEVDSDVDGIRNGPAGHPVRSEAKNKNVGVFPIQARAESVPKIGTELLFSEPLLDVVPDCLVGLVDRIEVARLGAKREDGSL